MHWARPRENWQRSPSAMARAHSRLGTRLRLAKYPRGPMALAMAMRSALWPVRACRCSKDQDPSSIFPTSPAARKCNRAARSDASPISDRYLMRHNRRALVGCGNRRSRWLRKFSGRAPPSRISASDKCRSVLRPTADQDDRFANSESGLAPPTKTQTCRKCPGKVRSRLSYVILHRLLFLRI